MQCNSIVHFYPDRCCQTQQPHHLKIENVAQKYSHNDGSKHIIEGSEDISLEVNS